MRQKYLIKAGITKLGKQQYINYYEDIDDWDISVVPLPLGKSLANRILKRVQKEYVERMNNGSTFKHKSLY